MNPMQMMIQQLMGGYPSYGQSQYGMGQIPGAGMFGVPGMTPHMPQGMAPMGMQQFQQQQQQQQQPRGMMPQ